jgi:hypothetical protein
MQASGKNRINLGDDVEEESMRLMTCAYGQCSSVVGSEF